MRKVVVKLIVDEWLAEIEKQRRCKEIKDTGMLSGTAKSKIIDDAHFLDMLAVNCCAIAIHEGQVS